MNTLLNPGEATYMNIRRAPQDGQPGALLFVVLVQLFHDGVSLTFNSHPILNRALPVDEGRAYLQYLQAEAAAGTPVWLIIERAGAWTTAAAAANEAALVADINTRMDEVAARRDTTELTADCQAIAASATRRDFTRTRVARQPLTPAELDLIRNAHTDADGNLVVTTRPGQTWLVLRAMHRRIGGIPTYRGNTRIITALTYRPEQLAGYLTNEEAKAA